MWITNEYPLKSACLGKQGDIGSYNIDVQACYHYLFLRKKNVLQSIHISRKTVEVLILYCEAKCLKSFCLSVCTFTHHAKTTAPITTWNYYPTLIS